ncbi:MAG TPA: sulfite exporter TauE/SafE family protein [Thermoleophilaceae bacterium]|nr:sulfite exporter TauE/SafE family protein [Thermoleophilaceae bacterium]
MSVAVVALSVLVGAALQSATGFGFALVTAPAVFAVFAPGEALTLLVLLSVVLSLLVLFGERRGVDVRRGDVARMTAWGIPGMAAGVLVLRAVDKPVLQVGVGLAVVAAAAIELRRVDDAVGGSPWPVEPVGVVAGLLTTTTGVNGPAMIMYYLRTGPDQHQVRDCMAATFLAFTPFAVLALALAGELGLGEVDPAELAGLVALVVVGRPLGRMLFLRMSAAAFRTAGIALALLAGLGSVIVGLAG